MRRNTILLIIITFSAGFLTHALIFPDILANGLTDVSKVIIPQPTPSQQTSNVDPLITKVYYDGGKFSKHSVRISFTRYIQIINTSPDKLMWLTSAEPELTTTRGYGQSEALKMQFNKKGQFIVADKNNPKERLVITVK